MYARPARPTPLAKETPPLTFPSSHNSMSNKNDLTDREKELLALSWLCFSEKPKPDYKKLAALAGMTNPVSASNAWAKIQKKITAQAEGVGNGSATPETGDTSKPTPKKRAKKGGDDDGGEDESPMKKAKKTPRGKVAKVKLEVGGEDAAGAEGAEEGDGDGEMPFL
ncbi:hypothetical protein Q7P37_006993 [Cladosporium fusiforme]